VVTVEFDCKQDERILSISGEFECKQEVRICRVSQQEDQNVEPIFDTRWILNIYKELIELERVSKWSVGKDGVEKAVVATLDPNVYITTLEKGRVYFRF